MKKRHRMSKGHSRRNFTNGASYTHKFNLSGSGSVMRGGIRL